MGSPVPSNDQDIIERFAKIFQSKDKSEDVENTISEGDLDIIAGRATQGLDEAHFEYLKKDKKFAWVMGGGLMDPLLTTSFGWCWQST
jgi:hypothetical protein